LVSIFRRFPTNTVHYVFVGDAGWLAAARAWFGRNLSTNTKFFPRLFLFSREHYGTLFFRMNLISSLMCIGRLNNGAANRRLTMPFVLV
jgi:hypothetical protein